MKKIVLIGFLLLTSACQSATPTPAEPSFLPTATVPASATPIPASSTPEPTATQTPEQTPTPFPRYFTHQFDASLAGWVILQAGNEAIPNIATENGTLRIQMDSPYIWIYGVYGPEEYANVHIETEFVNSGLSPASVGLVCRYSDTDGWLEYNVYSDGTYNVLYGKWLETGIADYLPIIDGSSKEIGQSGAPQQIGLTCSGTTLQLTINGTLVRSVDVTRYDRNEGKVGLTASSFENTPVIAVFNWVNVREP